MVPVTWFFITQILKPEPITDECLQGIREQAAAAKKIEPYEIKAIIVVLGFARSLDCRQLDSGAERYGRRIDRSYRDVSSWHATPVLEGISGRRALGHCAHVRDHHVAWFGYRVYGWRCVFGWSYHQ